MALARTKMWWLRRTANMFRAVGLGHVVLRFSASPDGSGPLDGPG
jgi:hypothetical protein